MQTRTKAAVATAAALAVLATGGVAAAQVTGSTTTAGHGHGAGGRHHGDIEHGQFVVRDGKTGQQVTRDVANGTVTAVSPTSISVKTGDGTSVTFVVSASTEVLVKSSSTSTPSATPSAGTSTGAGHHRPTQGTIASIHTGQTVHVMGTGTGPFAATRVLGS